MVYVLHKMLMATKSENQITYVGKTVYPIIYEDIMVNNFSKIWTNNLLKFMNFTTRIYSF